MSASLLAHDSINKTCARAWKITAHLCSAAHPRIHNSSALLLPDLSAEYVRDLLLARLQWMREQMHTMRSINLFTFIVPRDARSGDTVPVIVILHGSHVLQQSTIEALLNGTVGCTAT